MIFEAMASTPAMRATFSAAASIGALLRVEAGLARAGAACGLVPPAALPAIEAACAQQPDAAWLTAEGAQAGTVVIPLVHWLRGQAGEHGPYVHRGGTSQDIIDTALVLQLREGVALLQADLAAMAQAAASMATHHAALKMPGRTLLQPALPITLGLKAAYWLAAIQDCQAAIAHAAAEAVVLQCGGASGTLDAVAGQAEVFWQAFGHALDLPVPSLPWHTRRAPLLRLAAALAGAVGVAGKIGTDIALSMQPEVAELAEPAAPGRGGSSAMAHKRNPTLGIAARAAALRMPGFLATLAAAQAHEHERAAGAWQAEAATWPALMLCASGGLAAMAEALPGLIFYPEAMARNLAGLSGGSTGAASLLIQRALKNTPKEPS